MTEKKDNEKTLQKKVWLRLEVLAAVIVLNSLLAGYIVFWRDDELLNYNIFTIFMDIWYWALMLPGMIITCCSRFRWYGWGLMIFCYIIIVWRTYGTLNL